jgi:hypothetical protein
MLKVCMVVHQNYYQDGRVRRYVDTLLEAGVDVDVICLRSAQAATAEPNARPTRIHHPHD